MRHFASSSLVSAAPSRLPHPFPTPPLRLSLGSCNAFLFSTSSTIGLQWVSGHSFLPGNDTTDELVRWGALLQPSTAPRSLSPLTFRIHFYLLSDWRRTVSSKFFDTQIPSVFTEELVLPCHSRCAFFGLRCNGYSFLLNSHLSGTEMPVVIRLTSPLN